MINKLISKINKEFNGFSFDLSVEGNTIKLTPKDWELQELLDANKTWLTIEVMDGTPTNLFKGIKSYYVIKGELITTEGDADDIFMFLSNQASVIDWLRLNFICKLELI